MNVRFGVRALALCGLLLGNACVAGACDRFSQATVFAVPQQVVVLSAVPFAQTAFVASGGVGQAVVVQSYPVVSLPFGLEALDRSNPCFVPGAAVSVQSFGSFRAFGSGVSVAVNSRRSTLRLSTGGFNAAATGGRRTVIRQGGIRGLFFGNVVRSR